MNEPRTPVEAANAANKAIKDAHAELVKLVARTAKEIHDIWRRGARSTGMERSDG